MILARRWAFQPNNQSIARYCTPAVGHFLDLLAPVNAVNALRTGREN